MAALADIREGLRANLATLTDVQVSAYMLANPTPPTIQVAGLSETTYDAAMQRGSDVWLITVQALAGLTSEIGSQKKMDAWLASSGATSVKAAIESDATLGGVATSTRVVSAGGYQVYVSEGRAPVLGCEFTVQIYAPGT